MTRFAYAIFGRLKGHCVVLEKICLFWLECLSQSRVVYLYMWKYSLDFIMFHMLHLSVVILHVCYLSRVSLVREILISVGLPGKIDVKWIILFFNYLFIYFLNLHTWKHVKIKMWLKINVSNSIRKFKSALWLVTKSCFHVYYSSMIF